MEKPTRIGRRTLLTSIAMTGVAPGAVGRALAQTTAAAAQAAGTPATGRVTAERRGHVMLIGLDRPALFNRIGPPMRQRLGEILYEYEHDASLRAAVLFGHGDHFSRGIDVDAQTNVIAGQAPASSTPPAPTVDVLGRGANRLTKPLITVVHGNTWNLGHEIYLASDIRIAAANTDFGQDENTHGRFPGGGATVRFVRDAGWGNAMRYMLTGDHWTAEESRRMGITQEVAATPRVALDLGIDIANRISACGPLGIKATLASAHQMVDPVEADALSKLGAQYSALYKTEDFVEGRRAEAERRPPRYQGK